jgi:hypothetical protein
MDLKKHLKDYEIGILSKTKSLTVYSKIDEATIFIQKRFVLKRNRKRLVQYKKKQTLKPNQVSFYTTTL